MSYTDATDRTHTFYPVQPGSPRQPAYDLLPAGNRGLTRAGRIIGTAVLAAGLVGFVLLFVVV
ncbi:hypothetical protein ACI2LF_37955 [Kribbella sp. NPDC020789]